jgi:hypothetical protein
MGFAKPIDVGTGRVCASVLPDGSWLSISTYHPDHGVVELSGMPAFHESRRGDPVATRSYRELMARHDSAFLWLEGASVITMEADAPTDGEAIRIRLRIQRVGARPVVRVRARLDRPALAEITETHPPPATGATTMISADGESLWIASPELPASAVVTVGHGSWRTVGVDTAALTIPAGNDGDPLEIVVRLGVRGPTSAVEPAAATRRIPDQSPQARADRSLAVPDHLEPALERTTRTVVDYVRRCTALITGPNERTILTDHRLLPLSWTRDAYWQARLLLAAHAAGLADDGASIVEGHLRWQWLRTERPHGAWVRSHHANGRRKDLPYQADQQLYPMLELADYARVTGRLPELPEAAGGWPELLDEAWAVVERSRDPHTGLMRSDENASDDPAPLPLIVPSQILGWYTARRLVEMSARVEVTPVVSSLATFADELRDGLSRHAVVDGPAGPMWAYAIDGKGRAARFHDCGDLPTALAPLWGFCPTTDPLWRSTMEFAFSAANPAFASGPFGGLGSPHTQGTWPLGVIQEWVFASLTGARGRAERVLDRMMTAAADDGMLPEAYDSHDGTFVARHWFAWPGATLGVLWLLDRRGRLDEWLPGLPGSP